ncbi:MAG: hypothetical protein JNK65_05840 [Deltaproteobacteria bacterium]|nr:hypothetical protein [Deltaproteobacteria bacterium]
MTTPKPIQNELVLTDPDLSRLFLGQVPVATGFTPSQNLSSGSIDLSEEKKTNNKTPLKDISKKWESHRIVKSHLEFIDKTIDYKNDFPKYL